MAITNGYTTLDTLKLRLGGFTVGVPVPEDGALERAIEAVSRDIDHHTFQHFFKVSEARYFAADCSSWLQFGDFNTLATVSEVATDSGPGTFSTVWAAGDYQLLCKDGTPNQRSGPEKRPFTEILAIGGKRFPQAFDGRIHRVRITGEWGWEAIPTAVVEACLILATETFKLKDAPFGAAGMTDLGIVRVRDNKAAQIKLAEYAPLPGAA